MWLAEQHGPRGFRRRAVIKRIHAHLAESEEFITSFEDEARLAAQLDHQSIARVEDFGETDGTLYLVMEHVQGWTLKTLTQHGEGAATGVPTPLVLKVIAETARALDYAHHVKDLDGKPLHVVHRDVSPQNIMVTPNGSAKLLDFGVARSSNQQQNTRAGSIKGKLSYLSPEQVRAQPLDARSDLFSLGVVLWELVNRRRLFKGKSELDVLQKVGNAEIPEARLKADCPSAIAPVLAQALQQAPNKRFADGASFADAVDQILALTGGPPTAKQCGIWLEALVQAPKASLPGMSDDASVNGGSNPDGQTINLNSPEQPASEQTGSSPFTKPQSDSSSWSAQSTKFTAPIDINQSNLPRHMTRFIGRDAEVARLHDLMVTDHQLVTILGPGGMGKSRLAIHYASKFLDLFDGGAWFVDLSSAHDIDTILAATGAALSVPLADEDTDQAIERLGHAIGGRGHVLMIFDNFEQVVSLAEQCFKVWLRLAPQARFIVTSQRRLSLRVESVFELDPLSGSHGLDLFVACARKVRKAFRLKPDERKVVEEIVRRLDGIPLAIELAAARTSVLSPQKLLKRLSKRFSLLQSRDQDLSDRQRTLSSAIEWSWSLLESWEQDALAQCSVFQGGFFLEDAEEVIDLTSYPDAPMVMDVITDLKDKSLLRSWELPELGDELRFGMYESIRDFATAKRLGLDNPQAIIDRHAEHMVDKGTQLADDLQGADSHHAMSVLVAELENLLAVADNCPDHRGVQAILVAKHVLYTQGPFERVHDLLDRCVQLARGVEDRHHLIEALAARCQHQLQMANFNEVARDASEGLALADTFDASIQLANFKRLLGEMDMRTGDFKSAKAHLDSALKIARDDGDPKVELSVMDTLAELAFTQGDLASAQRQYERYQSLSLARGLIVQAADKGSVLGWLMSRLGRFEEAERLYRDTLQAAEQFKKLGLQASMYSNLGTSRRNINPLQGPRWDRPRQSPVPPWHGRQ